MAVEEASIRNLTTHHDGHGLNESIQVESVDEIGPGGAHHAYVFHVAPYDGAPYRQCGEIQFQRGPRNDPSSTPGVTEGAVLATVIDRLEHFQAGPFPSEENAEALDHLRAALAAIKRRADNRAARGVLGKNEA